MIFFLVLLIQKHFETLGSFFASVLKIRKYCFCKQSLEPILRQFSMFTRFEVFLSLVQFCERVAANIRKIKTQSEQNPSYFPKQSFRKKVWCRLHLSYCRAKATCKPGQQCWDLQCTWEGYNPFATSTFPIMHVTTFVFHFFWINCNHCLVWLVWFAISHLSSARASFLLTQPVR